MAKLNVRVKLTGKDGNAFAVLGAVKNAMKKAGHGDKVSEYMEEAMAGDYGHLLRTTMAWVKVE